MAWYESEAFWNLGRPFMFGPEAWDRARGEIEAVVGFLGVDPGARILDLCCGPGRQALELARRGFRVTGVDWLHGRHVYVTPEGRQDVEIAHRLYSGAELRSLLESVGFREVRLHGGFDGSPYDLEARRLVAVATK